MNIISLNFELSRAVLLLIAIASLSLLADPVSGQVADSDRAHISFDIDVDELRASLTTLDINLEDVIHSIEPEFDKKLTSKVKRIYGAIELPNDMAEFQAISGMMFGRVMDDVKMPEDNLKRPNSGKDFEKGSFDGKKLSDQPEQPISTFTRAQPNSGRFASRQERTLDQLPINFFIRVELMDEETAEMLSQEIKPPSAEMVTVNGKEYLKSGGPGPHNVYVHNPTATSFEIGTAEFVTNADRKVLTARCKEAWKATPKYAVRMAGELDSLATLVKELTTMASEGAPPMAKGPMNLIPKLSTLQVAVDIDEDNLLMLTVEGKDEAATDELNSVLSGLLMMGKGAFKQMSGQLEQEIPAGAEMIGGIVKDLELTKEGKTLSLVVAKPANFIAQVKEITTTMRARATEMEELNGVRQVVLSVHNYHDSHKGLPFTAKGEQSEQLSWRARVTPYMEGPYTDVNSAHDDPANAEFTDKMPTEFGDDGKNSHVFFVRPETPPTNFSGIGDGLSNTIMVMKINDKTIPWLKPGDITIDEAVEFITALKDGETIIAGRYDGGVLRIKSGLTADEIRPFLTPAGSDIGDYDIFDR